MKALSEDESDDEAEHAEYPITGYRHEDEPVTPPSLSKVDDDNIEESNRHLRVIAEESGVPAQDIEHHIDNLCIILQENDVFSGRGILSKISQIRDALTNEPEALVIINTMIAYLEAVNVGFTNEWATWKYQSSKAPSRSPPKSRIREAEPGEDSTRGKKRPIPEKGQLSSSQKKINKKVKRLSKKVNKDDEASSLSSSDSKEKKPREEASKLSAILQDYGENAQYLNQKVLPEAKSIVELSKKTRLYHEGRGGDDTTPYISSQALDDAKWVPSYVVQGLSKEDKKKKAKTHIGDQGMATLIQQVVTFWVSHIITGACVPEAVLTRVMMAIQNIQQLGVSEARTYEKKLISHFNLQIQQGTPPEDINEELSNQVDAVDKEVERDTKYHQRQKGKGKYPGKGTGKYPKAKSTVIPAWSGTGKSQKQGGKAQSYQQGGKTQSYQPKGDSKGKKGIKDPQNPQSHICFQHDPRSKLSCTRKGCQNQHLDTNIASEAKRFDDAKSIADANYFRKWGYHQ